MNEDIKQALLNYDFKDLALGEKWIKRYIRFIEGCLEKQFDDTELFEYHHIVPRSWDPSLVDEPNNIIKLPLSYHIVAHQLLALTRDRKMTAAFHILTEKSVTNIKHFNLKQVSFIVDQTKRLIYRPVVNLNTGETYCSLEEANRIADTYGLSNAIKNKTKVRGCYWQYKDVVDQTSIDHQLQLCLEHRKRTRQQTIGSFARPVINLNTGKEYPSAYEASRSIGVGESTIGSAIRFRCKVKGCYFQYKDVVEQTSIEEQLQIYTQSNKRSRPIINLHTGEILNSTRCLDERLGRLYGHTSKMIQQQHKINGQYWALLKDVEQYSQEVVLSKCQQKWQQTVKNRAAGTKRGKRSKAKGVINLIDGCIFESARDADEYYGHYLGWCTDNIRMGRINNERYWFMFFAKKLLTNNE